MCAKIIAIVMLVTMSGFPTAATRTESIDAVNGTKKIVTTTADVESTEYFRYDYETNEWIEVEP